MSLCRAALLTGSTFRTSVVTFSSVTRLYSRPKFINPEGLIQRHYLNIKVLPHFVMIRQFSSLPSHTIIKLPSLSPTMETGAIISWAKNEGDQVSEGDLLAEIETDKATMAMDASDEGFIAKIIAPAGTKNIPIGSPLCVIVESQDSISSFKDYKFENAVAGPAPGEPPRLAAEPTMTSSAPADPVAGARLLISPLARRLAEERSLDISSLGAGSGVHGMITSGDLDKAAPPLPAGGGPLTTPLIGAFTDVPLSGMRSVIAKRLTDSKQMIPHFYLSTEVCLDELLKLREQFNQMLAGMPRTAGEKPPRISLNDLLIKAMAVACKTVPQCNSAWHDHFIRQYINVDVCVAVAIPDGLVTPIIYNANNKGILAICLEVRELAKKAKENKLKPHEFQGGTITITNLGMFGVTSFSAIINPPQACILAVGSAKEVLLPDHASSTGFRSANMVSVTLCCDHRVVDGAVGARWLAELKRLSQCPAQMLL